MSRVKEIDLQRMAPLRDVSQKISQFLHQTLTSYVAPLTPLLAPQNVLGEFLEGFSRARVPGADKAFEELEQRFVTLCRDTFRLPSKLKSPVPAIKTRIEAYPWEYLHALGGDASRTITITSPTKWVLAYEFGYSLSNLIKGHLANEKPALDETKQLIINAVALWMMVERSAGVKQLLGDLRFPVSVETSPVSGDLPYIVVNSAVPCFRPQDDLITMVTMLSGRPVFEELVDLDEIENIEDPLLARLKALTA